MTALETAGVDTVTNRKPRDDEIDVYGLTHPGSVRKDNQDHFLICSLRKEMAVHHTSLPELALPTGAQRLAILMMVADGVGGGAKGEEASRLAVEAVTHYVTRSMRCYYAAESGRRSRIPERARGGGAPVPCRGTAARRGGLRAPRDGDDAHAVAGLLAPRLPAPGGRQPLLSASEGRAEADLARPDDGAGADRSGRAHPGRCIPSSYATTLSSSIGGRQNAPAVTRIDLEWGDVALLCSDGLTRHVSDEVIRNRLRNMTSSRQVCEELLQDALDGGGSDNITIVVRKAALRPEG